MGRLGTFIVLTSVAVGAYTLGSRQNGPSSPPPKPATPSYAFTAPPAPTATVQTSTPPAIIPRQAPPARVQPSTTSTPLSLAPPGQPSPQPSSQTQPQSKTEKPKVTTKQKVEAALTAAAIALILVKASREAYYASGRPCACPDDRMRNGRACGSRSAYSKPGGASPLCSPSDVTPAMIESYRGKVAQR